MYTKEMLESIKKVEATREERLKQILAGNHPPRMTAEEKDQVLLENHPDHIKSQFAEHLYESLSASWPLLYPRKEIQN